MNLSTILAVLALAFEFHNADLADLKGHLLRFFRRHLVPFGQFFRRQLNDPLLAEGKHEFDLLLRQQAVEQPEVGMLRGDVLRAVDLDVVGDHTGQFFHQFFLLRILADVIFIKEVVLIEHIVLQVFGYHSCSLPGCFGIPLV